MAQQHTIAHIIKNVSDITEIDFENDFKFKIAAKLFTILSPKPKTKVVTILFKKINKTTIAPQIAIVFLVLDAIAKIESTPVDKDVPIIGTKVPTAVLIDLFKNESCDADKKVWNETDIEKIEIKIPIPHLINFFNWFAIDKKSKL